MVSKNLGRSGRRYRQIRQQAYQRDRRRNATCWICGQPIDYSAPAGTPDAWEPDHRVPPKDAPELAELITNLMPSHSSCNRSRGDRAPKPGLGETSRQW